MTKRGNFAGSHRPPRSSYPSTIRRACCSKPCARGEARKQKKGTMSRVTIVDLEVFYSVGVSDQERAKPQRLLITVDMEFDFSSAALSDRLERTINYFDVAQEILKYGEKRSWKLVEKLADNLADLVL